MEAKYGNEMFLEAVFVNFLTVNCQPNRIKTSSCSEFQLLLSLHAYLVMTFNKFPVI